MFDLITRPKQYFPRPSWSTDSILHSMLSGFDEIFGRSCYTNEDGNDVYQLEVPGFNKENIKVELADGLLSIEGKIEETDEKRVSRRVINEKLTVGDVEDIKCAIKDGILTVELIYPKPEEVETKLIEVTEGD